MPKTAPLLLPAIAAILGIALSPYLNWTGVITMLLAAIACELSPKIPKPLALTLITLTATLYYTLRTNEITETPNQNANWVLEVQKTDPAKGKYQKIIATTLATQDSTNIWRHIPKTSLEIYVDTTLKLNPKKGNIIAARGKLRTLEGSYGQWLKAHGIQGKIYTYRAAIIDTTTTPPSLADQAENYRQTLGRKIAAASPDTAATALMATLTVSDRAQMTRDQKAEYRRAGASHLLAISGLHVGIIVLLLNLLLGVLRLRLKGRIVYGITVIALLWCYAWLTGMSPSVVRAVVMFSLLEIGLMSLKSTSALNLLAAAALVIVLWEPRAVFDIGFQLSFIAMLGIVTLFRPVYNLFEVRNRFLATLWAVVVVSVVAQLSTAPLVGYTFGQLPLLGLLTNVLVWVTVPTIIVGTTLFLIGVPVGAFVAWVAMVQNKAVAWVSAIEWGVVETIEIPLWSVWATYVLMATGGLWFVRRRKKR